MLNQLNFISLILTGLLYVMTGLIPLWAFNCEATELRTTYPLQEIFLNTGASDTQWLGGDGDTSVELGNGKILWFFGDTFLGRYVSQKQSKHIKYFIHDSVAVLDNVSSTPKMTFFFGRERDGKPSSFFKTGNKNTYFWILSAAKVDSSLVLGLAEISNVKSSFRVVGTTLAVIDNPEALPEDWHVTQVNLKPFLSKKEKTFLWSSGLIYQKPYLYLIGSSASGAKNPSMKLARIKQDALFKQDFSQLTFLTQNKKNNHEKQWQLASKTMDAVADIEGLPWMSEATVLYLKASKQWLSLNIAPFTFDIHLYQANKLSGPWKNMGVIYHIPKPWRGTKKGEHNVFISYAPKFHPGLGYSESDSKIGFIFSYINNLNTFSLPMLWDTDGKVLLERYPLLYTPILVQVLCQ